MARSLAAKPSVIAPAGNYPFGRIQDDDGSGSVGTPVNEEVYGDFHQFFEKLMNLAGLTANELPENNSDGFQFIQALGFVAWTKDTTTANWSKTGAGTVTFTNGYVAYKAVGKNLVVNYSIAFDVTVDVVTFIKFTFPAGISRTGLLQLVKGQWITQGATNSFSAKLSIETTDPASITLYFNQDSDSFPVANGYTIQGDFTVEIL